MLASNTYTTIQLAPTVPEIEERFIRHIEQSFRDVHRMMLLPAEPGLGDFGRTIALVLLATIDGLAFPLRDRKQGHIRRAFTQIVQLHFPWDRWGVSDADQVELASTVLFDGYRNLLAHGSGTLPPTHGQGPVMDLHVVRGPALTTAELTNLEARGVLPPGCTPMVAFGSFMVFLGLPALYWGTRELATRWSGIVTAPQALRRQSRAPSRSITGIFRPPIAQL